MAYSSENQKGNLPHFKEPCGVVYCPQFVIAFYK